MSAPRYSFDMFEADAADPALDTGYGGGYGFGYTFGYGYDATGDVTDDDDADLDAVGILPANWDGNNADEPSDELRTAAPPAQRRVHAAVPASATKRGVRMYRDDERGPARASAGTSASGSVLVAAASAAHSHTHAPSASSYAAGYAEPRRQSAQSPRAIARDHRHGYSHASGYEYEYDPPSQFHAAADAGPDAPSSFSSSQHYASYNRSVSYAPRGRDSRDAADLPASSARSGSTPAAADGPYPSASHHSSRAHVYSYAPTDDMPGGYTTSPSSAARGASSGHARTHGRYEETRPYVSHASQSYTPTHAHSHPAYPSSHTASSRSQRRDASEYPTYEQAHPPPPGPFDAPSAGDYDPFDPYDATAAGSSRWGGATGTAGSAGPSDGVSSSHKSSGRSHLHVASTSHSRYTSASVANPRPSSYGFTARDAYARGGEPTRTDAAHVSTRAPAHGVSSAALSGVASSPSRMDSRAPPPDVALHAQQLLCSILREVMPSRDSPPVLLSQLGMYEIHVGVVGFHSRCLSRMFCSCSYLVAVFVLFPFPSRYKTMRTHFSELCAAFASPMPYKLAGLLKIAVSLDLVRLGGHPPHSGTFRFRARVFCPP